jgi:hypothetical protein
MQDLLVWIGAVAVAVIAVILAVSAVIAVIDWARYTWASHIRKIISESPYEVSQAIRFDLDRAREDHWKLGGVLAREKERESK